MKLFYEKLKEELAKSIAQILIAAAMLFLTILIPKDVIRSVVPLIWFWLVVILSIICLTLAVYILKQRNKDIFIKELSI